MNTVTLAYAYTYTAEPFPNLDAAADLLASGKLDDMIIPACAPLNLQYPATFAPADVAAWLHLHNAEPTAIRNVGCAPKAARPWRQKITLTGLAPTEAPPRRKRRPPQRLR